MEGGTLPPYVVHPFSMEYRMWLYLTCVAAAWTGEALGSDRCAAISDLCDSDLAVVFWATAAYGPLSSPRGGCLWHVWQPLAQVRPVALCSA